MDIFSKILKNPIIFLKNHDFRKFRHRIFLTTRGQTLVLHPCQTIRSRTIKIGMHLREATPYGYFFKNCRKFNFFPKIHDYRKFGLGIFLGTRGQTLVQHSSQTIRPRTIKIDMHLPPGTPYGHFLENFRKSNYFSQKSRFSKIWT